MPSEYDSYFVSPLSDDGSVFFKDQRTNVRSVRKTLERNIYSNEVERNLSKLIDDTKPDFALVLLYLRKLSPAVLVALNKKGIPFAVRLSDYGMICPSHNLFRGDKICELCLNGNLLNSVRYKCVHGSYVASAVNYMATKVHFAKGYFDLIRHFVSPSRFLINKMVEAGWERERFYHLPTFANSQQPQSGVNEEGHVIYAGRLEHIKGVHLLLESMKILKQRYGFLVKVKVAGGGNEEYVARLKKYCYDNELSNVDFLGELDKAELFQLLGQSVLSVIPSLCYDNLPNSALESLSCGVPIIVPAHGCFPEIVVGGETGFLFEPGNPEDLASKMRLVLSNQGLREAMKEKSIELIQRHYSPEVHYKLLMSVIEEICQRRA